MCYTISKNVTENKLIARLNRGIAERENHPPQLYINSFGFPKVQLVKSEEKEIITSAYWGLIPSHIKTEKDAKEFRLKYLTYNAKSETVFNLPTYKGSILPRRCIIPVTGFIEHRHIDQKNKVPYYIKLKNEEIFMLAGLYNNWTNELGETKSTFSILTTEANPLMAKIHNSKKRMPLILPKELEEVWIDPALKEPEIKDMMRIFNDSEMHAHTIAKISPKTVNVFDEKLIEKFDYPEISD